MEHAQHALCSTRKPYPLIVASGAEDVAFKTPRRVIFCHAPCHAIADSDADVGMDLLPPAPVEAL